MKDIENQILAYLDGELSEKERAAFEQAVENDSSLKEELAQMQLLRQTINAVPVPQFDEQKVRAKFYTLLENEMSGAKQASSQQERAGATVATVIYSFLENLFSFFFGKTPSPLGRAGVGLILLLLGVGIGYFLMPSKSYDKQMTQLTNEMQAMKEMMTLTLLEQRSPTERLKAVNMTSELDNVNDKIINALLQTLDNDENINVRLAAVEALYNFRENPKAREGLVKSVSKQESALVQVALVEVIIALQDKKNLPVLRELIKKEDLNEAVKTKAESGIEMLQL